MAEQQKQTDWSDFAWQGLCLSVPEDWNLGKVDGKYESGYARLDDAEIVRAEIEWRNARGSRGGALPLTKLVDRYLENLEKKAEKTGTAFSVKRRAKFLKEKKWLEGCEYETFIWEADYRAYNLALATDDGQRIILLRVLAHFEEDIEDVVNVVFSSLRNQADDVDAYWCVYGMGFKVPAAYRLEDHQLRSGHIQLSFTEGKHTCRVHRLSLAHMLLKGTSLEAWYPVFFKKQLKDVVVEVQEEEVRGHSGLKMVGKPHSRWRQLLRPLPWLNPRPRNYLDGRVWYCEESNKIYIVEHLFRKKDEAGDLVERVIDGYICHAQQDETEPRSHARLAADPQ
jgi:hypothetical protein